MRATNGNDDLGPRLEDHGRSLVVPGFDPDTERGVEALLAVGNGHLGTRAALEEDSAASLPMTLVAGVYDPMPPTGEPPPGPEAAPAPLVLADWASVMGHGSRSSGASKRRMPPRARWSPVGRWRSATAR